MCFYFTCNLVSTFFPFIGTSGYHKLQIFVDAYLNDLDDYNSGHKPIWENMYLPDKVKLSYASADKDRDIISNFLIHKIDSYAKAFLKQIVIQKNLSLGKIGHMDAFNLPGREDIESSFPPSAG